MNMFSRSSSVMKFGYFLFLFFSFVIGLSSSYARGVDYKKDRLKLSLETNYLKVAQEKNAINQNASDLVNTKVKIKENSHPSLTAEEKSSLFLVVDEKKALEPRNRAMAEEFEKTQNFKKHPIEYNREGNSDLKIPYPKVALRIDLDISSK